MNTTTPFSSRTQHDPSRSDRPPRFTLLRDGRVCERVFELFAKTYTPLIRAIISRTLRRAELVEDICQETLLRVFLHAAVFDRAAAQDRWVKQIARRLCVDHLRRERADRCAAAFKGWYARLEAGRADSGQAEIALTEAQDVLRLVPKTYRDVLALALAGEPADRAAMSLGISKGAYRGRLHDAARDFAARL